MYITKRQLSKNGPHRPKSPFLRTKEKEAYFSRPGNRVSKNNTYLCVKFSAMTCRLCYSMVFVALLTALALVPKAGGYIWQPELINPLIAALFTLLVYLVARIAGTGHTAVGILGTALFTLLFCPDTHTLFDRDEGALIELGSTCIVPFFISQYTRISTKNFRYGYFLMLLMGIFCSYTHDGITIPLCAAFLLMSYLQRDRFFRMACWPMVTGFALGTTLALLHSEALSTELWGDLAALSSQTAAAFLILWETKVFIFATLLTIYFSVSRRRRRALLRIFHQHKLISYCLLFSFCTLPFAPLGLDNAISGVCFFCMFWVLFLFRSLMGRRHVGDERTAEAA